LIAAISINNNEELMTNDKDFPDIAGVSKLRLRFVSED